MIHMECLEENKNYQPQIDWLNKNLYREITERKGDFKELNQKIYDESQSRMSVGSRYQRAAYYLDERIQKLEKKINGKGIHKYICQTIFVGLVILILLINV